LSKNCQKSVKNHVFSRKRVFFPFPGGSNMMLKPWKRTESFETPLLDWGI